MDLKNIETIYRQVVTKVSKPGVPDHVADDLRDIERRLQPLQEGDVAEFVSRRVREAHRNDDRDEPICECPDPACDLKRGRLPYPLRRRESPGRAAEAPERRLRSYLRRHPDAVIVDEALDELQTEKADVARELRLVLGEARDHIREENLKAARAMEGSN